MNNSKIISIRYNKGSGEYLIKERDSTTGKTHLTTANRLKAHEVNWATLSKHCYEDPRCIIWAN